MNFRRRVDRIERGLGMKGPRYVLTILRADRGELCRENEPLLNNEIAPGVMVFVYNGELTDAEREELKAKYTVEER